MSLTKRSMSALVALPLLAACASVQLGSESALPNRGEALNTNLAIQTGDPRYLQALFDDFRKSVPDMVNFAFDRAVLEPEQQRILDQQAEWIRRHPSIRLRIFGHTDLVGSAAYNQRLGQRRADAVARYLVSRGVNPAQLEAVASFGKTRPLVDTNAPERRNRRTVTEVHGFVSPTDQWDFDGKRADANYQRYVRGEIPAPGAGGEGIASGKPAIP